MLISEVHGSAIMDSVQATIHTFAGAKYGRNGVFWPTHLFCTFHRFRAASFEQRYHRTHRARVFPGMTWNDVLHHWKGGRAKLITDIVGKKLLQPGTCDPKARKDEAPRWWGGHHLPRAEVPIPCLVLGSRRKGTTLFFSRAMRY